MFKDYIIVLYCYFILFFGKTFIISIDYDRIQVFNVWRVMVIGYESKASMLNIHNLAMNRVYVEVVLCGFVMQAKVLILVNNGEGVQCRLDFSLVDYRIMICKLFYWIEQGKGGKLCDMCELLCDYVLIVVNIGMWSGIED